MSWRSAHAGDASQETVASRAVAATPKDTSSSGSTARQSARDLLISPITGEFENSGVQRTDGSLSPLPNGLANKSSRRNKQLAAGSPELSPQRFELSPQRYMEWDMQESEMEKSTMSSQWQMLRDQLNTFSREVISLRSEMFAIKNSEAQLREQMHMEKAHREDLMARVDVSVRNLQEQLHDRGLRERTHRAVGGFEQELSRLRMALEEETHLRTSNARELEAALRQDLREQTARSLDELKLALQRESRERIAVEEELAEKTKARHKEAQDIREALEAEVKARIQISEESRSSLSELKLSLQDEAHARKQCVAEQDRLTSEIHKLQQKHAADLSAEVDARAAADKETSRLILQAKHEMSEFSTAHEESLNSLKHEMFQLKTSRDDLRRLVQDAAAALDLERTEREFADSTVKSQVASCLQDTAAEREARILETAALRRSLETLDSQVMQQLRDVKADMEDKAARGSTSSELFGNQVAELRHEVGTERGKIFAHVEERLKAFSHNVDAGIREREAREEEAARLALEAKNWAERELGACRQALQGFESQLAQQQIESQRLQALQESLEQADKDLAGQLRTMADQRAESDEEAAKRLRQLAKDLEQERKERELANNSLQEWRTELATHIKNTGEDMATMREAHAVLQEEFGTQKDAHVGQTTKMQELEDKICARLQVELAEQSKSSRDSLAAMQETHDVLQRELASHQTTMEDALSGQKQLHDGHVSLMQQLEDRIRGELQQVAADHLVKHGEIRDQLSSSVASIKDLEQRMRGELLQASAEHLVKHGELRDLMSSSMGEQSSLRSQTEERLSRCCDELRSKLESTVQEALAASQDELTNLKASVQDALSGQKELHDSHVASMQEVEDRIRGELQQVSNVHHAKHREITDSISSSLGQEATQRAQTEERLGKACDDLAFDLQTKMREANAALQIEFAEHSKNSGDMMVAMQKAHEALQGELVNHKTSISDALGGQRALYDGHVASMHELEEKIRGELQQASGEYHAKHGDTLGQMSSSMQEESKLRLQAEERLQKACDDLRRDLEVKMQDGHAEWQGDLANHKASTQDALSKHTALYDDHIAVAMQDLEDKVSAELQQLSAVHHANDGELRDWINTTLQDESRSRTQSEERLGKVCDDFRSNLESGMADTHAAFRTELAEQSKEAQAALQAELANHIASTNDALGQAAAELLVKHGEIRDLLDSSVKEESKLRVQTEERLGTGCTQLRSDLETAMQGTRTSLEGELAASKQELQELQDRFLSELQRISGEHHAQQNEIRDLMNSIREEESNLRAQTEERLGKACDTLRRDLEVAMREACEGSQVELAEHSRKSGETMEAVQEAHAALQGELTNYKTSMEARLAQDSKSSGDIMVSLQDALAALQDEVTNLKISTGDTVDRQKELHDGHALLQGILRVELQRVSDEHREKQGELRKLGSILREKAEDQLNKVSEDLRNELEMTLQGALASLRNEVAELGTNSSDSIAKMQEAQTVLQGELAHHRTNMEDAFGGQKKLHDGHVALIHQLEDRIRGELQKASEEHSAKLEEHGAKQLEFRKRSTVLREQAEDRLGQVSDDLRNDFESTMREALSALRVEVAELSKSSVDTMTAMQEAHATLKGELVSQRASVEDALGGQRQLHDGHAAAMRELEDSIRGELQQMSDMHHARQGDIRELMNASLKEEAAMRMQAEERLGRVRDSLHNDIEIAKQTLHEATREEVAELRKSNEDNTATMQQADAALQRELANLKANMEDHLGRHKELHDSHVASLQELEGRLHGELQHVSDEQREKQLEMEDRLHGELQQVSDEQSEKQCEIRKRGSVMRVHQEARVDKACSDLRQDLETSMRDSLAAMRNELAELCRNNEDALASPRESYAGQAESWSRQQTEETFNQQFQALTARVSEVQEAQERHNTDLQTQIMQGQEKLFAEKVLYSSEVTKLQESVENLKDQMTEKLEGQMAEKLEAMQECVENLKGQMTEKLFGQMAEKLEAMQDALKASDAALKTELASQSKDKSEMKAAMKDAHRALQSELSDHKVHAEKTVHELLDMEKSARKEADSGLLSKLTEIEGRLTQSIEEVSDNHEVLNHKFEAKSKELHTGIEAERRGRRLTAAIDNKMKGIHLELEQQECDVRTQAEDRLSKVCTELRGELEETMREVHAAFRAELAEHSHNNREMTTACQEALTAIKGELAAHKKLHDGHIVSMEELAENLHDELQQVSYEHHEKHLMNGELIGNLRSLLTSKDEEHVARLARAEKARQAREDCLQSAQEQLRSESQQCLASVEKLRGHLDSLPSDVIQMLQTMDDKVKRSVEELKKGIDAQNTALRDHLEKEMFKDATAEIQVNKRSLEPMMHTDAQLPADGETLEVLKQVNSQLESMMHSDAQLPADGQTPEVLKQANSKLKSMMHTDAQLPADGQTLEVLKRANSKLQELAAEKRSGADDEQEAGAAILAETRAELLDLQQKLQQDVQALTAAQDNLTSCLSAEEAARTGGDKALKADIEQLRLGLESEASARKRELETGKELEASARKQELEAEATSRKKDLEEESQWRITGDEAIERSFQTEVQRLETALRDTRGALEEDLHKLKKALEEEADTRDSGRKQLERTVNELQEKMKAATTGEENGQSGSLKSLRIELSESGDATSNSATSPGVLETRSLESLIPIGTGVGMMQRPARERCQTAPQSLRFAEQSSGASDQNLARAPLTSRATLAGSSPLWDRAIAAMPLPLTARGTERSLSPMQPQPISPTQRAPYPQTARTSSSSPDYAQNARTRAFSMGSPSGAPASAAAPGAFSMASPSGAPASAAAPAFNGRSLSPPVLGRGASTSALPGKPPEGRAVNSAQAASALNRPVPMPVQRQGSVPTPLQMQGGPQKPVRSNVQPPTVASNSPTRLADQNAGVRSQAAPAPAAPAPAAKMPAVEPRAAPSREGAAGDGQPGAASAQRDLAEPHYRSGRRATFTPGL